MGEGEGCWCRGGVAMRVVKKGVSGVASPHKRRINKCPRSEGRGGRDSNNPKTEI